MRNALLQIINSILQYEYYYKRIRIWKEAEQNFNTFKKVCPWYDIGLKELESIIEIIKLFEKHKKSPFEFVKNDKIVIMSDNMKTETVTLEKTKQLKPDLIFAPITHNIVPFFKQIRQLKLEGNIITGAIVTEEHVAQAPSVFEGVYRTESVDPHSTEAKRLFESYVAAELDAAAQRMTGIKGEVNTQLASKYLCTHQGKDFFQLKPDLQLRLGAERWILDTKWKLLDAVDWDNKYGLSQQDFYQLFAYGQYYLSGEGTLVLIYPAWQKFPSGAQLAEFSFNDKLKLLVLAFDLEAEDAAKNLILQLQQGIKHKLQQVG